MSCLPTLRKLKDYVFKHAPVMIPAIVFLLIVGIIVTSAVFFPTWLAWTGLQGKTVWDFAELVIVPISLALIAYLLSRKQRQEDREIARQQREQDQRIAEAERETDREIAQNREQERALQAYLDAMTALILKNDLSDPKVQSLARSRTLTVVSKLSGVRKGSVLRFLAEAKLIDKVAPVIEVSKGDFSNAELPAVNLQGVTLSGANLRGSNMSGATLREANLSNTDLNDANLSDTNLFGADLRSAILGRTNLNGAILISADLSEGFPQPASVNPSVAKKRKETEVQNWLQNLQNATFKKAKYDYSTKWPSGFDPEAAGAIDLSD